MFGDRSFKQLDDELFDASKKDDASRIAQHLAVLGAGEELADNRRAAVADIKAGWVKAEAEQEGASHPGRA